MLPARTRTRLLAVSKRSFGLAGEGGGARPPCLPAAAGQCPKAASAPAATSFLDCHKSPQIKSVCWHGPRVPRRVNTRLANSGILSKRAGAKSLGPDRPGGWQAAQPSTIKDHRPSLELFPRRLSASAACWRARLCKGPRAAVSECVCAKKSRCAAQSGVGTCLEFLLV